MTAGRIVERLAGRCITLAVTDDGPGIPAAALPHVFDRFYRADPSRTNRGSGLGLAIVRDLAEQRLGRVLLLVEEAFGDEPPCAKGSSRPSSAC